MRLPKSLTEGWMGNIFYSALGILCAVIFYFVILRFALGTDLPMVAVVSNSMKHQSTLDTTHYQWLETNLNYNRSYIDSWPIGSGFSIGDMPVIRGEKEYKVGDVIVYDTLCPPCPGYNVCQNAPTIHRIIKINQDGTYQTKGDNNNGQICYEYSVSKSQVHGKVIFIIPKLGYFKVIVNKIFSLLVGR
jgi:signal peptidase I